MVLSHAFECLGPCVACGGEGLVKIEPKAGKGRKGKRRKGSPGVSAYRPCKPCGGTGDCRTEWRGESPPRAPCREPDCCICSGKSPCGDPDQLCTRCYYHNRAEGKTYVNQGAGAWPCAYGGCPRCGSAYVEWLSYPGTQKTFVDGLGECVVLEPTAPGDVYLNIEVFGPRPTRQLPSSVRVKGPTR